MLYLGYFLHDSVLAFSHCSGKHRMPTRKTQSASYYKVFLFQGNDTARHVWWYEADISGIYCYTKVQLLQALIWPVATYRRKSCTTKWADEHRLEVFEMKALRQILWVSRTAKETTSWVLDCSAGRCQQEFTNKCKKQKVETFRTSCEARTNLWKKARELLLCLRVGQEEDCKQHGQTVSLHGLDWSLNTQSRMLRTDLNGERRFTVWPTHGSRTASKQGKNCYKVASWI